MKKISSIVALSLALSISAQAVTITIDTGAFVNFSDGSRVTDNTGVVSIGTYDSIPNFDSSSSVTDLLSSYEEVGSGAFEDSIGGLDGFFSFTVTETITPDLNGDDVYLVLGNGNTLASSDEFLVWRATSNPDGSVFVEDNPVGGPGTVRLDNTTGDVLFGNFDGAEFNLVAIPEPSSSVLLGLGGLALVLRRRR